MSNRYKIRQNLISIGDDFWIENEEGKKVYKVDGKVLRIRKTLVFEDTQGKKLAQIQERLLTIRDTVIRLLKCPRNASALRIPTASRSTPGRMTFLFWPWRLPLI